jgi:hypothetical protein
MHNHTMRVRLAVSCLLALSAACVNQRAFTPREHQNGTGPTGQPAALYALVRPAPTPGASSEPVAGQAAAAPVAFGELRIWSRGTSRRNEGGSEQVVLHVGFEIETTAAGPVRLDVDGLRCEDVFVGDRRVPVLERLRIEGEPEVAADATAHVEAWFAVSPDTGPGDVDGFSVRFRVLAGNEPLLQQVTPFVPWVRRRPQDDDVWYWGGAWGPGFWGPGYLGSGFSYGWYHRHAWVGPSR